MNNDFEYDMSEINGEEMIQDWDPIMGDDDEWIDTDDEWLDDFAGEEDFA